MLKYHPIEIVIRNLNSSSIYCLFELGQKIIENKLDVVSIHWHSKVYYNEKMKKLMSLLLETYQIKIVRNTVE